MTGFERDGIKVKRVTAWLQALDLAERWRSQPPFAEHPELWTRRLELSGITEEQLGALLTESAATLGERLEGFLGPEEALWLAVSYRDPNGWQLSPTGPDVYLGLPGIAYGFARLAAPERVPSILALAPPSGVAGHLGRGS